VERIKGYTCKENALERCRARFSNRLILLSAATAHANPSYNFAVLLEWDATGKDHHLAVVRDVDSEELVP
jgi:hypothetical protein